MIFQKHFLKAVSVLKLSNDFGKPFLVKVKRDWKDQRQTSPAKEDPNAAGKKLSCRTVALEASQGRGRGLFWGPMLIVMY